MKIDFIMPADLYDNYVKVQSDELKNQFLPYPLWQRKPEWTSKTKVEGSCPRHALAAKTYGACPSVKSWMNKTIVVPFPCDFSVENTGEEIAWSIVPEPFMFIDFHGREQLPPWETRGHMKLCLNFLVHNKKAGPILWIDPHLHKESANRRFQVMNGLIDSRAPMPLNVNILWDEIKEGEAIHHLAGDPLLYLTFPAAKGRVGVNIVRSDTDHRRLNMWARARQLFVLR